MDRFLRGFELDRLSFWLGFLAASLFWLLVTRLRPAFARFRQNLKERAEETRGGLLASAEVRHRNDTLRRAQRLHLAAPLFALDEVLIEPRVLAPPPPVEPGEVPPPKDITEKVLPYMPDWTGLAAVYGWPSLTLKEALAGGTNLALIGGPGSGKTVALAHLATSLIGKAPGNGAHPDRVPILIEALDLQLPRDEETGLLDPLIGALRPYASSLAQRQLPEYIELVFRGGRSLLLIDGLDEFPPPRMEPVVAYLAEILDAYPKTQVVAAASLDFQGGLTKELGFVPVAIQSWNPGQRAAFTRQWGSLWTDFIGEPAAGLTPEDSEAETLDPALLNAWLLEDDRPLSPLEITLKAWGAYAGDLPGPNARDAIEAYLARMTVHVPSARRALAQLSAGMLLSRQPFASRQQAGNWLRETEALSAAVAVTEPPVPESEEEPAFESLDAEDYEPEQLEQIPAMNAGSIRASKVLPGLIESGILVERPNGCLTLPHPVVAGYLAGEVLEGDLRGLFEQPDWLLKDLTLQYLASNNRIREPVAEMLQSDQDDPLRRELFRAARWLSSSDDQAAWQNLVMRQLADCLNAPNQAEGLRARAICALVQSGSAGVGVLLRQMLDSPRAEVRRLAALGCGGLDDPKAVQPLSRLLSDPIPDVRRAACLALAAVGNKPALEALAHVLLTGDDDARRDAAEALSNHPEEGHPTLQEGAAVDDLLVRRAVVFGLARVDQPWAVALIEKLQVDDPQWLVQTAAAEMLEILNRPNPRTPKPFPPLTELPWLIAFAGERGIGIAPGRPAFDLLYLALKDGSEEQRLAALSYLSRHGDESSVIPVYEAYDASRGEIKEAAFETLWRLAAAGIDLAAHIQYTVVN